MRWGVAILTDDGVCVPAGCKVGPTPPHTAHRAYVKVVHKRAQLLAAYCAVIAAWGGHHAGLYADWTGAKAAYHAARQVIKFSLACRLVSAALAMYVLPTF